MTAATERSVKLKIATAGQLILLVLVICYIPVGYQQHVDNANFRKLFNDLRDIEHARFICDADLNVRFCNPKAAKLTGYVRQELFDMNIESLMAPSYLEMHRKGFSAFEKSDSMKGGDVDCDILRQDKTLLPVTVVFETYKINGEKLYSAKMTEREPAPEPEGGE
jgi:PAS domain S-box-containing protein